MKNNVIILSDLWGRCKGDYLQSFEQSLSVDFEIETMDVASLIDIDINESDEAKRHERFIHGGIEKCVSIVNSKVSRPTQILAFSVGGVIAWRVALINPMVSHIVCVSATRLRHETIKPNCKIDLMYGEKDNYKPKVEWSKSLHVSTEEIKGEGHDLYSLPAYSPTIINKIRNNKII